MNIKKEATAATAVLSKERLKAGESLDILLEDSSENFIYEVSCLIEGESLIIDSLAEIETTWRVPGEINKLFPFKKETKAFIKVETYSSELSLVGATLTPFVIYKSEEETETALDNIEKEVVIYDKFDLFFQKPLAVIKNINSAKITEELNGKFELKMTITHDDERGVVKADNYVQVNKDVFRILEVDVKKDGNKVSTSIDAEHVYFELLDDYVPEADRLTLYPSEVASYLNDYTRFEIEVDERLYDTSKYPKRRITISRGTPIKTLVRMTEYWDLEIERFRRRVRLIPRLNENKIQLFKIQKNLSSLEVKESSKATTTRLYLIGREGLSVEGLSLHDIPYNYRRSGDYATFYNEDGVELGTIEVEGDEVTGKYLDSKFIDSFPAPKYGEIVEGEIDDKLDLFLKGIETINKNDESMKTYELSVQELFMHTGEIDRFGLGYTAILQDEDLLKHKEDNLVKSRIVEYTYNPFDPNADSKIVIGEKEDSLKLFKKMGEAAEKVEENSGDWDNAAEKVEALESAGLNLHWDSNKEYIELDKYEREIASLEAEAEENSDGQGSILVNLIAREEAEIILRVYDNGIEQLYSPIIHQVKKGYNKIGVPHGYYHLKKGGHNFSVTAQSFGGKVAIQPRGASYDVEILGPGIDTINFEVQDTSIKNIMGEEKSFLYIIGYNEVGNPILKRSELEEGKIYGESDFEEVREFKYIKDAEKLWVEFNGVFYRDFGEDRFTLYTQQTPWIFWLNRKRELWTQFGDNPRTAVLLAEEVIDASAVKGWSLKDSKEDMGLVAAYIKEGGGVYYRQLLGLNDIEKQYLAAWGPETSLSEAGSGNTGITINRLNDYRLAFSLEGTNNILISERLYVGQSGPVEFININTEIDPEMNIITVIKDEELPFITLPTITTKNDKDFLLKAPYKWDLRGSKARALKIVFNTSELSIKNLFVDESDPYILVISMEDKVGFGKLDFVIDRKHLIGIKDNNTLVHVDDKITLFDYKPEVNETVNFNLNLKSSIEVTKKEVKKIIVDEYANFKLNLSSSIDVKTHKTIKEESDEYVNFNLNLSSDIEVLKQSEIIS